MPISHSVVIESILKETENTRTFVLKPDATFKYKAGQFLTLVFPALNGKDEVRRTYSFSSTPNVDRLPCITVKKMDNGWFSRRIIKKIAVGDRLHYSHISGKFTLPEQMAGWKHIILFAAGSGIVPIFSLLKSVLAFHPHSKITLIYSSHNLSDTIFYHALKKLGEQHSERFTIEWLMSEADSGNKRRLSHFLLLDLLKKHHLLPDEKTLFYLCGPFEYMNMLQIVLLTEGIPKENIKQEHFFIPRSNKAPAPPDKTAREIFFNFDGKDYSFISEYPDTILSSALKNKIPLDYSCRSGQCGSCVAKCIAGKVWMQYNEILTESEIQEGLVLTCCGFPVGGPVTLSK